MIKHTLFAIVFLASAVTLGLALPSFAQDGKNGAAAPAKVLVFSRTAGFRHGSIPHGIKAMKELGAEGGFTVDATEDPKMFNPENLAKYQAVVFLNTTGDVLDNTQQAAFEGYIRNGGGYFGIHSAADTEYDWPFYGGMIAGAYFAGHPAVQKARVVVEDQEFPGSKMLPSTWERSDEWYRFRESPRKRRGVVVIASLDESSYQGGGMNGDHPIAWYQLYEGGRAIYTGGGHTNESFREPLFREHLKQSTRWAAGLEKTPPAKSKPQKTKTEDGDSSADS